MNHLAMPESPDQAYFAYCTQIRPEGNRNMQVVYDPYSGELTPITERFSFTPTITELHRHLVGGKVGQMIVVISSLLLAVTCIVGLILWLPLRGRTLARAMKRGQALDWHNALGLVAMIPLIVMAIAGVTDTWKSVIFPLLDKLQGMPSVQPAPVVNVPDGAVKMPIQTVYDRVRTLYPDTRVTGIQPSNAKKKPHIFIMDADGKNRRVFMDPYTGEMLRMMDGSGPGLVGWYRANWGKLHTFGPFNLLGRTIWGCFSLAGTFLVVTGLWVSVKRWRRMKSTAV
jgi:uncharacterized iron-regulated membrane protein